MYRNSITNPHFQQRFFAHMVRMPSGCLEWQGSKTSYGYGVIRCVGKMQKAHRIVWQIAAWPDPGGTERAASL